MGAGRAILPTIELVTKCTCIQWVCHLNRWMLVAYKYHPHKTNLVDGPKVPKIFSPVKLAIA